MFFYFFFIVFEVFQDDTLAQFFIHKLSGSGSTSVNRSNGKKMWLLQKQEAEHPTYTIIEVDKPNNLELFGNTPAQTRYLLHNILLTARGIGLYVNSDKTESMCFNQDGAISTLNDTFLSLRVFGLLSSSLLLFPQRFGRYDLLPSSGVCRTREPSRNFELRPLLNPRGSIVLIPLAMTGYKC